MLSKATSKNPKPHSMNNFKPVLILVVIAVLAISFQSFNQHESAPTEGLLQLPTHDFSTNRRNGKFTEAQSLAEVFTPSNWFDLGFPEINEDLTLALKHHRHVLKDGKFQDSQKVGNLNVTAADFATVIDFLLEREGLRPTDLHQYLDAHQIWGEDKKGHVRFTGYYTPIVEAKKTRSGKYQYPIYAKPDKWEGAMPTRQEIESEGYLNGLGLELAYTANPVDISAIQLQGSAYVDFVDTGERRLLQYAGYNGHRYRNIQNFFKDRGDLSIGDVSFQGIKRFLKKNPSLTDSVLHYNPSYTFFASKKGLVKGAGDVPLIKAISIAADPDFFPAGSVLLASFPIVEKGQVTHHEYRILLPQDVGGAIKGAGRIDVYCGVGKAGEQAASNLHHYGKVWMLTPKTNTQIAEVL